MKATEATIEELMALHKRYMQAHQRLVLLQTTAIEGMRKIGVGCITEKSRLEFSALQQETGLVLAKTNEIRDKLH
jgi:hypothetical protein